MTGLAFDVTAQKSIEQDSAVLVALGEQVHAIDDAAALCAAVERTLNDVLGGTHHVLDEPGAAHDGGAAGAAAQQPLAPWTRLDPSHGMVVVRDATAVA